MNAGGDAEFQGVKEKGGLFSTVGTRREGRMLRSRWPRSNNRYRYQRRSWDRSRKEAILKVSRSLLIHVWAHCERLM
jgi:hypothetical protein